MELTLEEVLRGKATRIKNNDYFPTRAYVEPFINRMSNYTDDFRIQVKLPDQITYTNDGHINTEDITYNRVYVEAILPDDYAIEGHKKVVGMVYGLDVRKPIAKIWAGVERSACTNLCVFNSDCLHIQQIEPEQALNFKPVEQSMRYIEETAGWINSLSTQTFDCSPQNVNECLGKWIRNCIHTSYDTGFGKVKLASSLPIDAYKLLFEDKESEYFVNEGETNMYNIYNSFTQIITDSLKKDIMSQCEKTLLIKQILEF